MTQHVSVSALPNLKDYSGLLCDRIYLALRNAILKLEFAPGEVIRKGPICEHFGVSRAPLSDALRKLSDQGLVEIIPQSGTRVAKLSMKEIREGSVLREALEMTAAEHAAVKRSENQLRQLSRNMQMQKLLVDDDAFGEFHKYDEQFHDLIMESSGISILPATVQMVSLQVNRARLLLLPVPGRLAETLSEHQTIFDAIQAGSPDEAAKAMRCHLRQLIKRLEPLGQNRPDLFDETEQADETE
ncbi:MAG: GntR family transcriptional regulator [Pseudomonadota bacterium]